MDAFRNGFLEDVETRCLPAIESRLSSFFDRCVTHDLSFSTEMCRYHFGTGGKRLRALIPSWVFAAASRDPLEAIPIGCALELLHNATLVHDDLQDGDTVRRGLPTVWKKYSGVQAINCGDALFHLAVEMVLEAKVPPSSQVRIIKRLAWGALQVIEGQSQEFLMKEETLPSTERYLEVIRGKTAALLACAFTTALEALEAPREVIEAAQDATIQAGLLFQIQDDLLDVYGDKQRGRRGSDLAEGKISVLVSLLNDRGDLSERKALERILKLPREATSDAEIAEAIAIFDRHGIREDAVARIRSIQSELRAHSLSTLSPAIHQVLLQLSERFLAPIQSILV